MVSDIMIDKTHFYSVLVLTCHYGHTEVPRTQNLAARQYSTNYIFNNDFLMSKPEQFIVNTAVSQSYIDGILKIGKLTTKLHCFLKHYSKVQSLFSDL